MNQNTFCKYCHRIPSQCGCTHPVEEQDESFDRTASHMAGEYVAYKAELTDEEIKDFLATFPIIFTVDDLCTFARAILRKAQEK